MKTHATDCFVCQITETFHISFKKEAFSFSNATVCTETIDGFHLHLFPSLLQFQFGKSVNNCFE